MIVKHDITILLGKVHGTSAVFAIEILGNVDADLFVVASVHENESVLDIVQHHVIVRVVVAHVSLVPIVVAEMMRSGLQHYTLLEYALPVGGVLRLCCRPPQTALVVNVAGNLETRW